MKKKEKKARKLIKKLKKRCKKIVDKNWPKYKKAGCYQCNDGQLYDGSRDLTSVTYYRRCACANVHSKKYKKFLEKQHTMSYAGVIAMEKFFYDNNSYILESNNETDRGW